MPPPLARPGRVWSAGGVCDCACREAVPRAGPSPCTRSIRTSCASQMFLVYPQMCVASSRLPWPPRPHHGWGWALGLSTGGDTFLWAAEFVSCFAEPLSLALREAQIPPIVGPQFPHQWIPRGHLGERRRAGLSWEQAQLPAVELPVLTGETEVQACKHACPRAGPSHCRRPSLQNFTELIKWPSK